MSDPVSMNERLAKAIGIYPFNPNTRDREEHSTPFRHSGATADRGLILLITHLPRLLKCRHSAGRWEKRGRMGMGGCLGPGRQGTQISLTRT